MGSLNTLSNPSEAFGMDYISPIKGKYLLVKLDYLSKLVELYVCAETHGGHFIDGVERWESSKEPIDTLITKGADHFNDIDMKN